ncbi:MAG: (5-formylfuran-3-yl)methyl phosphate synthase [Anaerolineae bacterium]|jgi:uncharacterized protein (UPF0264 family)
MTMRLLISVTTNSEVAAAVQGGADIVDVKNPSEGALGASPPWVIRSVREATPDHLPVSAALGDVPNLPGTISLAALGAADCGVQYVKIGLMGPRRGTDALRLLKAVCRTVNEFAPQTLVIASAYADAHRVNAFPPRDLPAVAAEAGVHGCLLDTAIKSGDNLFAHLDDAQLAAFVDQCHQFDLISALAGSLIATDIPRVQAIGADIIGFRTAACRGDRVHGRIDAGRVHQLKQLLAAG